MRITIIGILCLSLFQVFGQNMHFEPMKGFEQSSVYYTPEKFQFQGNTYILDNAGLQKLESGNWKYIPYNQRANSTIRPGVAVGTSAYAFFSSFQNGQPDTQLNICENSNDQFVGRKLPAPYNNYAIFDLAFASNTLFASVSPTANAPAILIFSVDFGKSWQVSQLSGLVEKYFYTSRGMVFFTVKNATRPNTPISYYDGTSYQILTITGLESEGYSRGKIMVLNNEFYWILSSSIFDKSTRLYKYNNLLSTWQVMQSPTTGSFTLDLLGSNNTFNCSYSGQDDQGQLFFLAEVENGNQELIRTQPVLLDYLKTDVPKAIAPKILDIFINRENLICFQDSAFINYQIFQSNTDFSTLQLLPNGLELHSEVFEFNKYFYFLPYQYATVDGSQKQPLNFSVTAPISSGNVILSSSDKRLLIFFDEDYSTGTRRGRIKAVYELKLGELNWKKLPILETSFNYFGNGSNQKPAISFSAAVNSSFLTVNEKVYEWKRTENVWNEYFSYYNDIQESYYYKDTLYVATDHYYGSLNPVAKQYKIVANTVTSRSGKFFIKSDSIFSIDEKFCWSNDYKGPLYGELAPNVNELSESSQTSQFCRSENEEMVLSIEELRSRVKNLYYFLPGTGGYVKLSSDLAYSGIVSKIQLTPERKVIVNLKNGGTWISQYSILSVINSVGEIPETNQGFILYPNPCTSKLTIQTDTPIYTSITDITGKLKITSESNVINTSILEPGIYIIAIRGSGVTSVQKFIKQ